MAKSIRGIDIYLPLEFNDGSPIPAETFTAVQKELLKRFGGVTSTQRHFPLQGIWQSDDGIFYDSIVVFSAMDFQTWTHLECLQFLKRFKNRLKKQFVQLEILITVNEMLAV